jgi:hypothetical protein
VNDVGERLHAVDGDDWDALAVAPLQLLVPADIGLLQLKRNLRANLLEHAASGLAEVTPACEVESDAVHCL